MVESIKHVRVDNWGVFFLQRLQMFFNKTDYCDLTLQFDGNVQLKVHRLVMNACTEYFQVLEQTCDVVDDSIILMPPDLQADVILPIVNFMYTGTLEYHPVIYERLVRTAELMNIPILIKLLEAHKAVPQNNLQVQKLANIPQSPRQPKRILNSQPQSKKVSNSLPNTLPGRKLPVWKRKNAPVARSTIVPRDRPVTVPSVDNMGCGATSGVGALVSTYKSRGEMIQIDNEPKPTRFEWPDGEDDKIKTETYMESSAFENLTSYSSIPLIKGEDTERIPVYDELRHYASSQRMAVKRRQANSPYTGRRPNQPSQQKQQQISVNVDADESSDIDDNQDPDDPDYNPDMGLSASLASTGGKRGACTSVAVSGAKRSRFNEKENSSGRTKEIRAGTSKGTIERDGEGQLNHSVLLTELLKKFPNLANTNKNIKLKIMTKSSDKHSASGSKQQTSQGKSLPCKVVVQGPKGQPIYKPKNKYSGNVIRKQLKPNTVAKKSETEGPWLCNKCEVPPDAYHLYYLYRKHMTDVHQEQFSSLMCKFCGKHTRNSRALSFHMHTVHGASLSNIIGTPFPQCDRCSFTALSERRLVRHKQTHRSFHVQCLQCKVGFTGLHALATHQQITSHVSRDTSLSNPGMTSYDCQYCTRHWQNCAMLFVHLRTAHREDARRDGIVSIDEDPEEEEDDEVEDETMSHEDECQELEHSSAVMVDKVNVIADLKVAGAAGEVQMQVSNASIATTLGLVDIVVLDENQQYILQSTNGDLEQSEFILPQITGSFVHQGQQNSPQHQQQATNHITQLKQSTNQHCVGTTTTDELVMVLTDHDYNDETTDGHASTTVDHHVQGNGNIVVLYSHPVQSASSLEGRGHADGGGSLLVQTAEGQVLEIRNSHSNLVNHSSQQESIELIQREITNSQPQHILIQQEVSIEDEGQLHQKNQDVHLPQHNPEELVEEDYQEGEQHQENHDEHLQQQHPEESIEEDFQDGELKEVETQGDDMGFNVESEAQEEQQVMLVVAEDDESIEEASQIDQVDQSCEQLEEEQSAEAIDEQDSIVLRPEQEEAIIGQQDMGQDVCGLQDGTSVIAHQQHEQQVPEAMEVDETEGIGDVPSQVAPINNTAGELNAESTDAETTLSYNTSHPLKLTELPTIRVEIQEAKEAYSGQYSEEIALEKNSVGDIAEEQQLQSASEAANIQESDKNQAHYSPEAMEVDCRQSMSYTENKDADTTDDLDDSIVQHSQSIDEQLNQEDNENVANSTFEEDDNQGDDVVQGISNTIESSGAVQEALARNEDEEQLTNTSKNEVEVVVDDEYGNPEIISEDHKDDVENNEDRSLTLYSDDIERAMESIHSSEESTSINPSFTEVKNSNSASQNSTIALLDEWEDTEDSSSQDKNCPTVQPICQTTTSMTSAVNKLINDDWDDDE